MAALIEQHGPVSAGAEYLGKQDGHWVAVPTSVGSTAVAALRPHRPDEAVRRARRDQDVPGRRAARQGAGGGLDLGFLLAGGREMPQGRLSVRHAGQHHQRRGAMGRRDVQQPTARSWSTPRARSRSRATPPGTVLEWFKRTVPFFPPSVFAWDDASNNKALISGPERADLQRAVGLGGRQARRAESRRAAVDLPAAERAEGPACLRPLPLLGDLELLAQQSGGEEPAAATCRRADAIGKLLEAGQGFDVPPFEKLNDFRSGPRPSRPRARSTISRRAARSSCRSPATRRRPRSACRCTRRAHVQDDRPVHPAGQIDRRGDRLRRSASSKAICAADQPRRPSALRNQRPACPSAWTRRR